MSYDRGDWHSDTCAERGLPEENAATHIALYVKWCILHDLISDEISKEDSEPLNLVRSRNMSASEYFDKYMDWKFGEWCLNSVGNTFTSSYYDQYLKDLDEKFPQLIYGTESSAPYDKLSEILDKRFAEFQKLGPNKVSWVKKPWWKVW
jgi:hypothetical protein